MNVRSAESDDFEAITAVARAAWHEAYDDLGADLIDRTVDDWYTDDSMPLEAPGTVVLVAEDSAEQRSASSRTQSGDEAGEIIAFTHAVAQGDTADILRMYVEPDAQGRGIGTELHEYLLERLALYDVERVRAFDFAFNDVSRRFYEGLGFEQTDGGEVTIEGETYDETVYEREL